MQKLFLILLFSLTYASSLWAKTTLKESNFNIGIELTSKYLWRGIEYGDAPVIFGTVGYSYKRFTAYALGGYATNGNHSEVDLGLSYSHKWFTIGASDYFFPSEVGEGDNYFNFKKNETRHSMEGYVTIAPLKVPVWMTLSTYFYGADKNLENKQAYSSYLELGYSHAFKNENTLSLAVGANLNKSFYTQYEDGFNVVNIAIKYATGIPLGKFTLPVSGTLMYNPYVNKPFFSLSLYLNSK